MTESKAAPKPLRVFVASPGDTGDLRVIVSETAKKLNRRRQRTRSREIVVIKWETDTIPSVGSYVQDVINRQITEYDVLIVIFRKRFGTPTPVANSGTEEEFERAYRTFVKAPGFLEIIVFVSDEAFALAQIDPFQLALVQEFRRHAHDLGVLVQEFRSVDQFTTEIERVLVRLAGQTPVSGAASAPASQRSKADVVTNLPEWRAVTRTLYPQWATFREIPIIAYLGHPISLRGTFFTDSPYFRFGFKTMLSTGSIFGEDTVQTSDPNVVLHIGRNFDRPQLFLAPYRNGKRVDENIDLLHYEVPRPVTLRVDFLGDGAVRFFCDDELRYEVYSPIEHRQRLLLLAWGDHNHYDIVFSDIELQVHSKPSAPPVTEIS